MAVGDYAMIGRAADLLRVAPEPGWQAIESRVIAAVRAAPRGGWPLDVDDPEDVGATGGVIRVSALALTTLLSRALRGDPGYRVVDIRVEADGTALQGVSVDLSCRYLADAMAAGQRIRARSAAVIADVIGTTARPSITVTVTDVHR